MSVIDLVPSVAGASSACGTKIPLPQLLAIIEVECGGVGFHADTGKIIIQFEPHLFARYTGLTRDSTNKYMWDENKVDIQAREWPAFNEAFHLNANAAMEATSLGLPQILGTHWKRLGYSSVGAMWDSFKASEGHQIMGLIKFIETDKALFSAVLNLDWGTVASRYNGSKYKELAAKLGREPYNVTLERAYDKYNMLYGVK